MSFYDLQKVMDNIPDQPYSPGGQVALVRVPIIGRPPILEVLHRLLVKVVLGGYRRCPDSHDLSECHHLYDLGRHI